MSIIISPLCKDDETIQRRIDDELILEITRLDDSVSFWVGKPNVSGITLVAGECEEITLDDPAGYAHINHDDKRFNYTIRYEPLKKVVK